MERPWVSIDELVPYEYEEPFSEEETPTNQDDTSWTPTYDNSM